jgi:lipoprotein-anchoring transpeptidase ErfK/SrfK
MKTLDFLLAGLLFTSTIKADQPKIIIDLSTQTLSIEEQTYKCVVGSPEKPTPTGMYKIFYLREPENYLINGRFGRVYGRRYINLVHLRTGIANIGIHGTNNEEAFLDENRKKSRGCVRLKNSVIENRVYPLLTQGDYVFIKNDKP